MTQHRVVLLGALFAVVTAAIVLVLLPDGPLRAKTSDLITSTQPMKEPTTVQSEIAKYAAVLESLTREMQALREERRAMSIERNRSELLATNESPSDVPRPAPATESQLLANAKKLEAIRAELVKSADTLKNLRTEIFQLGDGRKEVLATIQEQLMALRGVAATPAPITAPPPSILPASSSADGELSGLLKLFAPVKSMPQLYAASAGEAVCKLLIAGVVGNIEGIENGTETLDDAIRRIGVAALSATLHPRCTVSPYWRLKVAESLLPAVTDRLESELRRIQQPAHPHEDVAQPWMEAPTPSPATRMCIPQTFVDVAQIPRALLAEAAGADPACPDNLCRLVPVAKRTYANLSAYSATWHLPPAEEGGTNRTIRYYAATFAIAKGLVRDRVSRLKLFNISPAFPTWIGPDPKHYNPRIGRQGYELDHSAEYLSYQVYHHSKFCFGMFRSGPDRQGHTEMLSQGCVLFLAEYFGAPYSEPNPPMTNVWLRLLGYPRYLMMEATRMPGLEAWSANAFRNEYFWRATNSYNMRKLPPGIDMSRFNETRYFEIAEAMLDFTRKHLTCGANMAHVLRTIGYEEPKKVLLLTPEFDDYQSLAVECGVAELGLNYVTNLIPQELREHWPPWQKPSPEELRRFLVEHREGSGLRCPSIPRQEWQKLEHKHSRLMYGFGFAWGAKIEPPPHPREPMNDLIPRIYNDEFDLVVVSNFWLFAKGRGSGTANIFELAPILEAVRVHFTAQRKLNRVVFFDGGDGPRCPCQYEPKLLDMLVGGSTVFVRELVSLYDTMSSQVKQGVIELDFGAEGHFIRKLG